MQQATRYFFGILTSLILLGSAVTFAESPKITDTEKAMFAPIKSVKTPRGVKAVQVKLGQQLFHDKRLSKNHDISCNSCHTVTNYGVDGEPTSLGHKGHRGGRNSPTVMNAFAHLSQFWDGRAADVEAQAKGPVLNPGEMAMPSADAVVATLNSIPGYVTTFKSAFPNEKTPVTYDNFAKAVGAFERQLSTPSRFDRYLAGDEKALTEIEKLGLKTFISTGCTMCHNGALLGGSIYQKLGLVKAWPNQKDQGRYDLTKNEADRMMFKVPSLRNIEKTGPYFHDGQTKDLSTAIKMMAEYQLGRTLSEASTKSIIAFLKSTTAQPSAEYLKTPSLPKSGPKTPTPDPS
jgi:cytochrome c peroxidase